MKSRKFMDFLVKASEFMCSLMLSFMTILIVTEVLYRAIFNKSTLVADEYSSYMMVIIVYWGLTLAFDAGSFIRIEFIYSHFKGKFAHLVDSIFTFVITLYNGTLCYFIYRQFEQAVHLKSISSFVSRTPLYIPKFLMFAGSAVFQIYLIIYMIRVFTGKEKIEFLTPEEEAMKEVGNISGIN